MDPVAMEGKGGEPVMFSRVLSVRCAEHAAPYPTPACLPAARLPACAPCGVVTPRAAACNTNCNNIPRLAPNCLQVVKASQLRRPAAQLALPAAAGNRGIAPAPAGPMDVDGDAPTSPQGRRGRGGARKQPASPTAAQPLSPSAADAAAAALAAAADRGGGEASTSGRELVPLPDQLQQAVEAAMASGGPGLKTAGARAGRTRRQGHGYQRARNPCACMQC